MSLLDCGNLPHWMSTQVGGRLTLWFLFILLQSLCSHLRWHGHRPDNWQFYFHCKRRWRVTSAGQDRPFVGAHLKAEEGSSAWISPPPRARRPSGPCDIFAILLVYLAILMIIPNAWIITALWVLRVRLLTLFTFFKIILVILGP